MQIIDNSSVAYKHFFLQGYRAQAGGAGPGGTDVEKVGVLVVKQAMNNAGDLLNDKEVLLTDELYIPAADPEFIRMENDIAVSKPALDVVVVDAETDVPEFNPLTTSLFFVQINRSSGATQTLPQLAYGWRSRTASPGRLDEAGNAGAFAPDVNQPGKLPPDFDNTFFNGGRVNTLSLISTGDRVVFDELLADGVTPSGFSFELTVPAAPQISIGIDDTPLDPQPAVELGVDTVVLDKSSVETLFVWRAVFPWDDAFEAAVLEIS